jgi:hypothetical protein
MTNKTNINNLFEEHNDQLIERFEIIFDRAQDEKTAKFNAVDYYLCLQEEGKDIDIDLIINAAESYGFDFDDFDQLVKETI